MTECCGHLSFVQLWYSNSLPYNFTTEPNPKLKNGTVDLNESCTVMINVMPFSILNAVFWIVFPHFVPGGWGGSFWVGMCRWDPGTLSLYQSYNLEQNC